MLGILIDDRCISGLNRSLGRNKDTEVCIRIIFYKLLSVAKCVEIPEESNSYFSLFNTCLSKLAKVKSSLLRDLTEVIQSRLNVALISALNAG